MDFLTNNPLVNMPGPAFLGVYAAVAAFALIGFHLWLELKTSSDASPPPPVPLRPDPYEIAYLRGGAGAVVSLAIYSLKRAGALKVEPGGSLIPIAGATAPENPIEAQVWLAVGASSKISQLMPDSALRDSVDDLCASYRRRLKGERLLTTAEEKRRAFKAGIVTGAGLIVFAAYKLLVALAYGHKNVGFLVIEAAIALFLLGWCVLQVTNSTANARGKAYLQQFPLAFSGPPASSQADGRVLSPMASGAELALVGAIGFTALEGTEDEAFAKEFKKNSGSGDGGGSSCSSGGDGGGGGGCGGCGGGGD